MPLVWDLDASLDKGAVAVGQATVRPTGSSLSFTSSSRNLDKLPSHPLSDFGAVWPEPGRPCLARRRAIGDFLIC